MGNYWIADSEGVYALVDGAASRDEWVLIHGWHQADMPAPTDQVHVVNDNPAVGRGRLPFAAIPDWSGLGWKAGPPPAPVDVTKDPVLVDQPSAGPVKSKSAASAADAKE